MPLIRNRMTITPSPTKIQISKMCEKPNISPPLSSASTRASTTKGTKVHEEDHQPLLHVFSRAFWVCLIKSVLLYLTLRIHSRQRCCRESTSVGARLHLVFIA